MIETLTTDDESTPGPSGVFLSPEIASELEAEAQLNDLAFSVGQRLAAGGARIVTAESCTGGAIARALTERAGSSAWFDRAFITYSNQAKQDLLGVPGSTLDAFGAVSEPVAQAMVLGALQSLSPALPGLALSVTGIAGPGGAVAGKPVGTVCFGWAGRMRPQGPIWLATMTRHWDGDRGTVRRAAAFHALRQGLDHWLHNQVT
jgi:nicotinamide-nucleotide amidase